MYKNTLYYTLYYTIHCTCNTVNEETERDLFKKYKEKVCF